MTKTVALLLALATMVTGEGARPVAKVASKPAAAVIA